MNSYLPNFDSAFLSGFVTALKKRTKALKHKTREFSCERVIEEIHGDRIERLDFELIFIIPNARMSYTAWEDREVVIHICEPSKEGWKFQWTRKGRIGPAHPKDVIKAIEASLLHSLSMEQLSHIWEKIILSGPQNIS